MATYILKTKDGTVREFWCPNNGGYVYEIDENHPGTTGKQVSWDLHYIGDMMWANEKTLAREIRKARRRELYDRKWHGMANNIW